MLSGCDVYLPVEDVLYTVKKSAIGNAETQFGSSSSCTEREASQFLDGFNGSLAHLCYRQLNGHTRNRSCSAWQG
jgi:hypothetical protein